MWHEANGPCHHLAMSRKRPNKLCTFLAPAIGSLPKLTVVVLCHPRQQNLLFEGFQVPSPTPDPSPPRGKSLQLNLAIPTTVSILPPLPLSLPPSGAALTHLFISPSVGCDTRGVGKPCSRHGKCKRRSGEGGGGGGVQN